MRESVIRLTPVTYLFTQRIGVKGVDMLPLSLKVENICNLLHYIHLVDHVNLYFKPSKWVCPCS